MYAKVMAEVVCGVVPVFEVLLILSFEQFFVGWCILVKLSFKACRITMKLKNLIFSQTVTKLLH